MSGPPPNRQSGSPIPEKITRQTDVLPTDRRGVCEPLVRHDLAGGAEVYDRIGHIGRVPIDDRGDKEVQPRGPVLLRLGAAVRDPSLLERADSLSERVALLAFVQSGLAAPTELGAFQPVEHEERALDAAKFLERQIELILALVCGELSQHCRRRDGAGQTIRCSSMRVKKIIGSSRER